MKTKFGLSVLLVLALGMLTLIFPACSTFGTATDTDTTILESELFSPDYELEFLTLAEGDVEIRQVTATSQDLSSETVYHVDFENQNKALMVPLSLLAEAEEKGSFITIRYHYPEDGYADDITFYLPYISEYEIYFPDASQEDISLVVGDVVVAEQQSTEIRSQITNLGATADEQSRIYATQLYLVDTSGDEPALVKLSSIEERLIMREQGNTDEYELGTNLYLSDEGDIYEPAKTVYSSDDGTGAGLVDTYLYGSFMSVKGELDSTEYADIKGHYAEDAILQVQQSRAMASALTGSTEEGLFRPDEAATAEDVLNAQGAFFSQPLMSERTYEHTEAAIKERYAVDQMFHYLIDAKSDVEVRSYVARVPYGTAEVYETLGLEGSMDSLVEQGLAMNSRISAALLGIGAFRDDAVVFGFTGSLAAEPTAEHVATWLTGITDVAEDDPLRSYIALAVKYGLLSPTAEGKLNAYAPISRADLCLLYANLDELYAQDASEARVLDGYSQSYLYAKDHSLHFNIEGTWGLTQATRADGTAYTPEQVESEQASFVFKQGESTEYWTGETYDALYLYCAEERVITLHYANGEKEQLSFDNTLMELTYHYVYEDDPEFSGEVYVFTRE